MSARHLTAVLLAVLCVLQALCLRRTPDAYSPASIKVTLVKGESVTLGRQELAAPHAAPAHLAMRRDTSGQWWIRNVSAGRQVVLVREDGERRMGSAAMRTGQRIQIGPEHFRITQADEKRIAFTGAGHNWSYDGALLLRDGSMLPACPGTSVGVRTMAPWNRIAPHALTQARPLAFGGNLHCSNRLGIGALAGASALMARTPEAITLSHAGGSEAHAPILLSPGAMQLAGREEPLDGVRALGVGRTRLALDVDGDTVTLRPSRQVALFTEQRVPLPRHVSWQWQQRAHWALPDGAAAWSMTIALLVAAMAALSWQGARWPFGPGSGIRQRFAAGAGMLIALTGLATMILQRSGSAAGAGVSMLLCWAALWTFLYAARRPALASRAAVLLLAAGLLTQLEMGLGASDTLWLRHFQKTSALLAMGLGAATIALARSSVARPLLPARAVEWTLAALAALALCGLGLQVLIGDETGVFDLQPVEFAKLALAALTAHCIAIGLGRNDAHASTLLDWARLAAPALVFAVLLGFALLQVDDYSPLILLLIWAMTMALAWSAATGRKSGMTAVAALACLAAGAVAWIRMSGGDGGSDAGFYADRFAVWLDPASHPHTGQQMLLAAGAIADGAWWGAGNWLGIGTLGQSAGSVLHIPAVQDDFAPAFFIHRHGLLAALLLWCGQALFIAGLLHTACAAHAAAMKARDFRHAWRWRFRCFVLCGGAAFVAGHLLLSWGTNLAIFPIMGQPMSFLSAGGSHLLFFICPLLAFHAVSAQSIEEEASCRSMSNTKSWARFTTYSMPKTYGRRRGWRFSRAARCCAICWNALRASFAAARRPAAFRT